MSGLRVWCYLLSEHYVILHQLPGELHAVLDVDVVVLSAVYQHEPPAVRDVVSDLDEAGEDVAAPVVLLGGQSHEPLGVGGVVVVPLSHGGHGDPAGDLTGLLQSHLGHDHAGHVAAVAPAPDTDLLLVNELEFLRELLDHVQSVRGLQLAQLLVHGVFEGVPLEARAPHVNVCRDEVPLAGEVGVPRDGPLAAHCLSAGPRVSEGGKTKITTIFSHDH